ncbi:MULTISPECIES: Asp23/Gls24 family envelope stress response protein [Gracilibacillus]|uniref:Asp23/Gls24 family envelope stress response protein n=1 Tax=Gracilibacillus TaxID=74385 RepID=UPI000825E6C9|nr:MULTISPECIES: Asp23/Gls24 family envelope stress response protein [Gracilibacillus]
MAEDQLLSVGESTLLGKVEIAPDVLEVIAGIATEKVAGVANMRGNFAAGVAERLGKKTHGKGIKLDSTKEVITMDVYIDILFGYTIPTIAYKIQQQVKQAIENMTAIRIAEVNVHVVGVHTVTNDEKETGS